MSAFQQNISQSTKSQQNSLHDSVKNVEAFQEQLKKYEGLFQSDEEQDTRNTIIKEPQTQGVYQGQQQQNHQMGGINKAYQQQQPQPYAYNQYPHHQNQAYNYPYQQHQPPHHQPLPINYGIPHPQHNQYNHQQPPGVHPHLHFNQLPRPQYPPFQQQQQANTQLQYPKHQIQQQIQQHFDNNRSTNLLEVAQLYQQQNLENDYQKYQNVQSPDLKEVSQEQQQTKPYQNQQQYSNRKQDQHRQGSNSRGQQQNSNYKQNSSQQRQSFKEYQSSRQQSSNQDSNRNQQQSFQERRGNQQHTQEQRNSDNSKSRQWQHDKHDNRQDNRDRDSRSQSGHKRERSQKRSRSRSLEKFNKPQTVLKSNFEKSSGGQLERFTMSKNNDQTHRKSSNQESGTRSVQKSDIVSLSSTSRLASRLQAQLQNGKRLFEREDYDYIRSICKKANTLKNDREQQEKEERKNSRSKKEDQSSKSQQLQVPAVKLNQQKSVDQRVLEAKVIAEQFYLLYETNWNKYDDVFYIINRRWFDRWKDYISYDYIVRFLIDQGRKESELSINKILSNNSNPGEISNLLLLMDKKDYHLNKSQAPERTQYLNTPLKNALVPEKDFIVVSENVWRFLSQRYKGEEIKRYAIYRNEAAILERQPYLPMLQVCLVLRDEAIRPPKWMIIPRKSTFEQVKWIIKDVFNWLKDYLDDEIRLWRLHPELRDMDFIEQYNTQLSQKSLPKVMKFPGSSMEKSLKYYVEEYQTFDRFRETLFIEVRKVNTISLFELDFKDNRSFDEGAFNTEKHLQIYSLNNTFNENWQNAYNIFYKFTNNTLRDYWDVSYKETDLYAQIKKQVLPVQQEDGKNIKGKASPKSQKNQGTQRKNSASDQSKIASSKTTVNQNKQQKDSKISAKEQPPAKKDSKNNLKTSLKTQEQKQPADIQKPSESIQILPEVDKTIKQKCGCCSKIDFQHLQYECPLCQKAYYCNDECAKRDQRFHQSDCEEVQRQKQLIIDEENAKKIQNNENERIVQSQQSNTVDVVSESDDDSDEFSDKESEKSSDSESNAFSSSEDGDVKLKKKEEKLIKKQTIIEIDKSKLIKQEEPKKPQNSKVIKTNSIIKFDESNLPAPKSQQSQEQSILSYIGKRKKSNQSLDSSDGQDLSLNVKRMKIDTIFQQQVPIKHVIHSSQLPFESTKNQQIKAASQPDQLLSYNNSMPTFKLEQIKEYIKPFLKPRKTQTQDEPGAKLGSLLTILTQLHDLKQSLTIEQGPLNAIIMDVLTRVIDQNLIEEPFMLPFNKLERHLDLKMDQVGIFNIMVNKLAAQNQSLLQSFAVKQKFSQICLNCGDKQTKEYDQYALELDNFEENNASKFSVKLKIIYIYDLDSYQKYEIQLKPGEYSFQDVTQKIRDKIQIDHPQLKIGKKTFLLVDLHYDYTVFGQMISNENMKFNFKQDQTLTTFAYEISKAQKDKIKRLHFVHIAKSDQDSRIVYQTFPRLIMYSETDQVRNVSLKVFKGLRQMLSQTLYQSDPLFMQQSESEAYNQLFHNNEGSSSNTSSHQPEQAYEMVLVMQDGSRWKLDPTQKQKLNQIVDVDMITRFEVIFPIITSFVELKQVFKLEFEKQISSPNREQGMRELQMCIRKYIRQNIVPSDQMFTPQIGCEICKEQKGAQQVKELLKLSPNLILKINKQDTSLLMEYPLRISLDKFISKSSDYGQGNEYEIVGGITQEQIKSESQNTFETLYSTILYNSKDNIWYRYLFGQNPQQLIYEAVVVDDKEGQNKILLDKSMDIIIYKKVINQDLTTNKQFFKKF